MSHTEAKTGGTPSPCLDQSPRLLQTLQCLFLLCTSKNVEVMLRKAGGKANVSAPEEKKMSFLKALAFSVHIMSPNTDSFLFCPFLWILNEKVEIALGWIWASSLEKVMDLKKTEDFFCSSKSIRHMWGTTNNQRKSLRMSEKAPIKPYLLYFWEVVYRQKQLTYLTSVWMLWSFFIHFFHPLQHLSGLTVSDDTGPLKELLLWLVSIPPCHLSVFLC